MKIQQFQSCTYHKPETRLSLTQWLKECDTFKLLSPRRQQEADLLKDLHWLPVRGRVDYKIVVLCYKAVKLQQTSYRILLIYSRHTDSRAFWGHLRQTYCQHSLL